MGKIKGITVKLITFETSSLDAFGAPITTEVETEVENVLVSPASSTDIVDSQNLYGKKAVYTLGIPKGDTNDWKDVKVEFFGTTFRTFGMPIEGIDSMVPLDWNKKVMVEVYE